jgi:nitrate/nitrite transporter NarK
MHLLLFSYSLLKELIALEMRLTYAETGFVFSLSVLALVVLRIPWGFVIDKLGVRVSAGLALTLLGVFGFLRGFAIDYETLLLFQLFMGVGLAAVMPCLPKLAAVLFPPEKTSFTIGVSISGYAVGDVIALIGTPYLLTLFGGWRNVFHVYGAWALILTVFWWILSRELGKGYGVKQLSEVHYGSLTGKDLIALFRNRQVWLLSGLYFSAGACYDTLLVWLPSILAAEAASSDVGFVTSMLPLGFFAASFIVGALSDKVGLRKPFILLFGLITGPAIYFIGILQGPVIWFFAFLAGFCTIGVLALVLAIPVELPQTAAMVGSAVGLISSIGNLGSFFMPTIVGYVRDAAGSFFWSLFLLSMLGEFMLILGLLLTETGRKRAEKLNRA